MAETKKLYTLADILGEPITEQEAQNLIRKRKRTQMSRLSRTTSISTKLIVINYCILLWVKMGFPSLMTQFSDMSCFREETPNGWNIFFQSFFDQPIHIKQILPREGSQIVENGSFVIADIIASMEDGSIINVEIQKIGYAFPRGTEQLLHC